MSPWTAAMGVAATFVWLGMVVAISFMEAPLRFRAPGVTVEIGLGIGRLVFRALNAAEVLLGLVVVAAMVGGYPSAALGSSVVALAALTAQLIGVRPLLRRRTAGVLRGAAGRRSHAHLAYVVLETVKAAALLMAGVFLLVG